MRHLMGGGGHADPVPTARAVLWTSTAELGVERVVLGVGRADVDVKEKVVPFLDRYAKPIPKLV